MRTGDIDNMLYMIKHMINNKPLVTKNESKDDSISFAKELENIQKSTDDSIPGSVQLTLQKSSTQAPFNINQSATCVDCKKVGRYGDDIKQYKDCDNLVLCTNCHDKRIQSVGD